MADRFTMILTCTSIFVLFFVKLFRVSYEWVFQLIFFLIYFYISGLVLAVDSSTYEFLTLKLREDQEGSSSEIKIGNYQNMYETYMNLAMLFPLGMILLIATCRTKGSSHALVIWLWLFVILNLAIWNVNAYLCRHTPLLFILHALFHVTIALTFVFAACVGMTLDGEWEFGDSPVFFWPMIRRRKVEGKSVKQEMDSLKSDSNNVSRMKSSFTESMFRSINIRCQ